MMSTTQGTSNSTDLTSVLLVIATDPEGTKKRLAELQAATAKHAETAKVAADAEHSAAARLAEADKRDADLTEREAALVVEQRRLVKKESAVDQRETQSIARQLAVEQREASASLRERAVTGAIVRIKATADALGKTQ